MKKYIDPEFETVDIDAVDIITTSPGTETTPEDETDGDWEIGLGL